MRSCGLLILLCGPLLGQAQPSETLPTFEIADVHSSNRPLTLEIRVLGNRGPVLRNNGRYEFKDATMVDLVRIAYNVDADKVLGGPNWVESDRFDVIAQTSPKTSLDTTRLMLRALLADRFKLVVHNDARTFPTYALSVSKAGHKLKESDRSEESGCKMTLQQQQNSGITESSLQTALQNGTPISFRVATFLYSCTNMTMGAFADQMRNMTIAQSYIGKNPIADQTGLQGPWDFNFKYTQKPPTATSTLGTVNGSIAITMTGESISLFDAMEKQLGLKLEAATLPIPVFVIDSVNRKPTDNSPEVSTKLPAPTPRDFEVAEIRLTAAGAPATERGRGFQPNGQIDLRNYPLRNLISLAWDLPAVDSLADTPKWLEAVHVDLIAKTAPLGTPIDLDLIRPALQSLLMDRFKVKIHTEMRTGNGWTLTAVKPKLAKADPADRSICKDGPGKDGKDPRVANPIVGRLLTCQNMSMGEFVLQLPTFASGYFRLTDQVLDATGLTDRYDFTISFSAPGLIPGLAVSGVAFAVPRAAENASGPTDPNGAVSFFDAITKQVGLKVEQQKRQISTIVLDHVEEKPTDN